MSEMTERLSNEALAKQLRAFALQVNERFATRLNLAARRLEGEGEVMATARQTLQRIANMGTDCPAAMQEAVFYRDQLHTAIGLAARQVALEAVEPAVDTGLYLERVEYDNWKNGNPHPPSVITRKHADEGLDLPIFVRHPTPDSESA